MMDTALHDAPCDAGTDARADAPDWNAIAETITCPLCEYELRGLTEPRCPECGYRFTWPELFESAKDRSHPYLFESHPRHNIWSFACTKLALFLPGSFWQTLRPDMRGSRARLIMYWLIPLPLLFVMTLAGFVRHHSDLVASHQQRRSLLLAKMSGTRNPRELAFIRRFGSVQAYVDTILPPLGKWQSVELAWSDYQRVYRGSSQVDALGAMIVIALWPMLTFASLLIFQTSMHRAKVKTIHMLRAAIYSAAFPLVACALFFVWQLVDPRVSFLGTTSGGTFVRFYNVRSLHWLLWGIVAAILMSIVTTVRLAFAYDRYLRFPHPFGTAFLAQLVCFFAATAIMGLFLTL